MRRTIDVEIRGDRLSSEGADVEVTGTLHLTINPNGDPAGAIIDIATALQSEAERTEDDHAARVMERAGRDLERLLDDLWPRGREGRWF